MDGQGLSTGPVGCCEATGSWTGGQGVFVQARPYLSHPSTGPRAASWNRRPRRDVLLLAAGHVGEPRRRPPRVDRVQPHPQPQRRRVAERRPRVCLRPDARGGVAPAPTVGLPVVRDVGERRAREDVRRAPREPARRVERRRRAQGPGRRERHEADAARRAAERRQTRGPPVSAARRPGPVDAAPPAAVVVVVVALFSPRALDVPLRPPPPPPPPVPLPASRRGPSHVLPEPPSPTLTRAGAPGRVTGASPLLGGTPARAAGPTPDRPTALPPARRPGPGGRLPRPARAGPCRHDRPAPAPSRVRPGERPESKGQTRGVYKRKASKRATLSAGSLITLKRSPGTPPKRTLAAPFKDV